MIRFILKSFLFIIFIPVVLYSKAFFLLYNDKYKETVLGIETYHSIQKSKKKSKVKKILLGDSVGCQLFDNNTNNDTINSFACNQNVAMVGHFLSP